MSFDIVSIYIHWFVMAFCFLEHTILVEKAMYTRPMQNPRNLKDENKEGERNEETITRKEEEGKEGRMESIKGRKERR